MRIQTLAGSAALLAVSLAAAAPAMASWNDSTASSPVYGYEDGSKFGKMYGNFYNSNGTTAMSTSWQYDMQPGGNNVRVETDFQFKRICGAGATTMTWCPDVSKQTDETNDASWYKHSRARNFRYDSEQARGVINICEIQAWSNDPCSASAFESFSY